MKGSQLFAVFIAVLMVASILGYYTAQEMPSTRDSPDGTPPEQDLALDFIASDVEASVFQILPTIKIQAETEETDIVAINSSIYAIEGVKKVSGRFEQRAYTMLGTGFVYVADISFSTDMTSYDVIKLLEDETSLKFISGYNFALVELPTTVSLTSVDKVLNLSREHEFTENLSESLVSFDSMEKDQVKISLEVTFVGDNVVQMMAYEEENITATPVEKTVSLTAPIASLEKNLLIEADNAFYSQLDFVSNVESDINALPPVETVNIFVSDFNPVLSFTFEEVLATETFSKLESFLNDLNAETVSLANEPLNASIAFKAGISGADFLEKKLAVEAKLEELGIEVDVEEAKGFVAGEITLKSEDSGAVATAINALFEEKGISIKIVQPGVLAVAEIEDSELTHMVESGEVQAMLKPGHGLQDHVNVGVDIALVRGLLSSATANEQ